MGADSTRRLAASRAEIGLGVGFDYREIIIGRIQGIVGLHIVTAFILAGRKLFKDSEHRLFSNAAVVKGVTGKNLNHLFCVVLNLFAVKIIEIPLYEHLSIVLFL